MPAGVTETSGAMKVTLSPQFHAEVLRRLVADQDAELAGFEALQRPFLEELVDDRNLALLVRVDGVDQHLLHRAARAEQALHLDEGRDFQHVGVLRLDLPGDALPVGNRLVGLDRGVGHHAQHAGTHLVVEAVHHGKHHDHHHHAQREADHGGERNEGYEVAAAFGACVARSDVDGKWSEHEGPIEKMKSASSVRSFWRATSVWRGRAGGFTLRPSLPPWVRHVHSRRG